VMKGFRVNEQASEDCLCNQDVFQNIRSGVFSSSVSWARGTLLLSRREGSR
jgi:hypothetical protein